MAHLILVRPLKRLCKVQRPIVRRTNRRPISPALEPT